MKNTKLILFLLVSFCISFSSCEKSEGEGGKSSIEGRVYKIVESPVVKKDASGSFYFQKDTILAAEQDVYIIYGSNIDDYFGDDQKTDKDGKFCFDYLVKGNYIVYAYSDYGDAGNKVVYKNVYVGSKGSSVTEDFYVYDGKQVGLAAIVGNIQATGNYTGNAVNEKVYCREVGVVSEAEKVETDYEGNYCFTKLKPGVTYEVWSISQSKKNGVTSAVKTSVDVPSEGSIVVAETLTIGVY